MVRESSKPDGDVVLIVDDEPRVRQVARRFFEADGYTVLEAGDGRAALDLAAGGARIDVLMADLDMPGIRGDEMAAQMVAARPGLKVLYVTGNVAELFEGRQVLGEGEAFLGKPFSQRGLLEAMSLLRHGTLGLGPAGSAPGVPTDQRPPLRVRLRQLLGRE